jgi:thiol-disulfide isomerase/thioredoxin
LKKAVVLLILPFLALVLFGCGPSQTQTPSPTTQPEGGETPSTLTKPVPEGRIDQFKVDIKFKPDKDTPAFFRNALALKKPILVGFYAEGDALTDSMMLQVDELQARYKGKVTFILINANRPRAYGNLIQQLPLEYVPQVLIFNAEETIIRSFTGYVDKETLEQGIYDAIYRGY